MHRHNWDDLRIALAVAETGSVAAAAKRLGVAHTTILRRISAFETETGARLFHRTGRGYVLNDDQARAFRAMRQAGKAVESAWEAIDEAGLPPGETLRLTSTDSLTTTVLPVIAASLRGRHPGLDIALLSFNTHLNLSHGQADLTIRPALALPEELEGEVAAQMALAEYVPANEEPEGWVIGSGPLMRTAAAQHMAGLADGPGLQADSFVVIRELVAAGHGRSFLPCILGDSDARLRRADGPKPAFTVPVWVAGHRQLADTSRIRRLRKDIVEEFEAHKPALAGLTALG